VAELAAKLPYYHQRHSVQPGLTGWAQINYPYGNTVEDASQKLQFDIFYIKYQSLLFDLSILFNTIKTVMLRKGTQCPESEVRVHEPEARRGSGKARRRRVLAEEYSEEAQRRQSPEGPGSCARTSDSGH
jgi:hypothetical protein